MFNITNENRTFLPRTILLLALIFLIGSSLIGGYLFASNKTMPFSRMSMDEKRMEFIGEKEEIIGELIVQGDYACCLKKPCTYCIEKTPGHGEGAICSCLEDVASGVHPCGECIGEILEGHGNRFLAPYFATAIAEEVGMEHLPTLKTIISEKYDISIEEQF